MTSLLDVPNPDSATPGEVADAAVAAGLSEDDVSELTRLSEDVRYGERDAATREELAVSVFRSVEESYGAGTSGDGERAHGSVDDQQDDDSRGDR
jgi:hypothetical protein